MSNVTRQEKIETEAMEAHLSGDSVFYVEKLYTANAWRCDGCGLVWEKRHQAQECESRKHVTQFDQHYGGTVINGVHQGGSKFTRYAIRREKVEVPA